MIWSIPVLQDATIYESDPYRNAGLDPVLELRKDGDVVNETLTESRILIKFDTSNLSSILSENSVNINSVTASLKLYTVQESELPNSYTIEAYAIGTNWENGSGYSTYPSGLIASGSVTDGATWLEPKNSSLVSWSGSLSSNTTASFYSNPEGGGIYYTGSITTQTFNYKTQSELDINVSSIVKNWYNSVYNNNGILLKFDRATLIKENSPETNLQFYGAETNTIYEPQLYISWPNTSTYSSGSLTVMTINDNAIMYTNAFKGEFRKDVKCRVNLAVRPKYPRPAFTQNSIYSIAKALPENSYYQIKDAHNDKIIIPFSNATKITTISGSSYFDFYSTMMYGERYYKFEIKTEFNGINEYFDSNEFTFKIIN